MTDGAPRSLFAVPGLVFEPVGLREANVLLDGGHYLGPLHDGPTLFVWGAVDDGELAAVMVWRLPSARHLPTDGSWWELGRWYLPPGRPNLGSRMFGAFLRHLRRRRSGPVPTTLVSYSDPGRGHTGALYRACGWEWRPTWHRLRPPPTGNGSWDGSDDQRQGVKDRWVFAVRADDRREAILAGREGREAVFIRRRLAELAAERDR